MATKTCCWSVPTSASISLPHLAARFLKASRSFLGPDSLLRSAWSATTCVESPVAMAKHRLHGFGMQKTCPKLRSALLALSQLTAEWEERAQALDCFQKHTKLKTCFT